MRILLLMAVITWHAASSLPNIVQYGTETAGNFAVRSFKVTDGKPGIVMIPDTAVAEHEIGNFVYSSISVTNVLAMAAWGAANETKKQLFDIIDNPYESVHPRETYFYEELVDDDKAAQLNQASRIFLAEGFTPKRDFTFMMSAFFRSEAQSVNFADPAEASKTINDWCASKTNDLIKEIVQPGDLSSDTGLVLASAVYFKGYWVDEFDIEESAMRPFHVNEKIVKEVPTMRKVGTYNYGELPEVNARFVELPYKTSANTDRISMFVILPNAIDGINELIKNFEKVTVEKLHRGEDWDVELSLPKFKIASTLDLKSALVNLGLTEVFGDSADFSEITTERPLKVSKIIQKNYIDVNEHGTEAASATGLVMDWKMLTEPEVTFTVDRPFISLVVTEFGVPVITTVIVDPRLEL